jgi:hypothetical protein
MNYTNISLTIQSLRSGQEIKDVQDWLKGIQKPVPRYEKCLSSHGNYVEK